MKNYREFLKEEMKNPEFKREWDALEPEFRMIREQLEAENKARMSSRRAMKIEEENSGMLSAAV